MQRFKLSRSADSYWEGPSATKEKKRAFVRMDLCLYQYGVDCGTSCSS